MRIEKFLGDYPNANTAGVYRAGIFDFFDCIYGGVRADHRATKEEKKTYEKLADRYFKEDRDYFEDMLTFISSMHGKAPIGAKAKISGVKEFLYHNGVEFTHNQEKRLSTKLPKGNRARTAEKDLDVNVLKRILTHMDLKGRVVVLTLASSGMRIGEVVRIELSDVDLSVSPAEIVVRGEYTKSGDTRLVFISSEAAELIREWLTVRDRFLSAAEHKNKGVIEKGHAKVKPRYDTRLFPFSDRNVRENWDNALKKTGLWGVGNSTGRTQLRVHALRKFFRSQLALTCPLDIVEALMGHEGYLTEAYRRYTNKQMAEYYLKAEQHVTIFSTGDLRELQERLQETWVTVKGYRDIVTDQAEAIAALKEQYETHSGKITQLEKLLEEALKNPTIIKELAKEDI
jgi:integrase